MSSSSTSSHIATSRAQENDAGSPFHGKALVLGPKRGVTERISQQLAAEGIEPVVPGLSDDLLPSLSDPNAFSKMREVLQKYAPEPMYLHPGLSVWAERPELSILGQQCGFSVIAPPSRVMNLFGNKLNLFQKAEEVGIPNLVIEPEPMSTLREIENFIRSRKQKFPFILKAAKGGSRFGLTAIHEATDLESKLPLWMEQLRKNCGEVILFVERYLEGSRLIVIPFARFLDGRTQTFPSVDASLQCRHRKVIEFCPAQGVDPQIEKKLIEWTRTLAAHTGYVGVGALEFLVESNRAYLIGGTPRLNAAFHLWERVAGTNAISWQLAAMKGGKATPVPTCKPTKQWGAGISLRLYAEDSLLQLPQPGIAYEVSEKKTWKFPTGEAELTLSIGSGDEIQVGQQGWIGTLWVGAHDKVQALRLARGVSDELWIAGSLQTNVRFLSELLSHPWIGEGIFHTGFVDEEFLPALRPPVEWMRIFASVLESIGEGKPGCRWAVGDQWVKSDPLVIQWTDEPKRWTVAGPEGPALQGVSGSLQMADGRVLRVCAYPLAEGRWQVKLGQWVMLTRRAPGRTGKVAERPRPRISSLISGKVHSILFREGATVQAHDPILIVESLGMLIPHALPVDVRIDRWKVAPEQLVQAGQDLAEFEILAKP